MTARSQRTNLCRPSNRGASAAAGSGGSGTGRRSFSWWFGFAMEETEDRLRDQAREPKPDDPRDVLGLFVPERETDADLSQDILPVMMMRCNRAIKEQ